MDITVNKQSVMNDVSMSVSIVARSIVDTNGNSLYDKVRIQERDNGLIVSYVNAAYGNVLKELADFIEGHKSGTISLATNRRLNESAISDLPDMVHNYMVNYTAAEWMKIKAVEYATVFSGRSDELLNVIFKKLRFKAEPKLKKFGE